MKKSIIGILILALIFIIPSCEMNPENPVGNGGIHISIKDMKYADEYILTYMGPESNAVNVVDSHSIYLANIKEGKYSYELQAKYKGILIGNSSGEFTIRPNENVDLSINVDLTKGLVPVVAIGANGDYDRVELTLYDGNTMKQLSVVTESNTVMVLNPGLYVLGVKAYKNEVCMAAAQSQPIVVNAIEADPVILSLSQFSADVVFSCGIEGGDNYKLFIKPVENSEYTVIESLDKDISITQLAAGMYKYKMMVFCDSEVIAQSEERSLSIESNNKLLVDVPMTREKTLLSISVSNVPVDRFREEILVYSSNGQEIITKSNDNAAKFWLKPGDYKIMYIAYDTNDLKLGASSLVNTSVVYEGSNTENLIYEPINASQEIEITNISEADRYIVNYYGLQQGTLEFNGVKTGCISTLPAGVYFYDAYAYSGDILIGRILNQSFTVDSANNGKIYITLEQTKFKANIAIDNAPSGNCIHTLKVSDSNNYLIRQFDSSACEMWLECGPYNIAYSCNRDDLTIGDVDYSTIYVTDSEKNEFAIPYRPYFGSIIFVEETVKDSNKIEIVYAGPESGSAIIELTSNGKYSLEKELPVGHYTFTVKEYHDNVEIASLLEEQSFTILGNRLGYSYINAIRSKNELMVGIYALPDNIDGHKLTLLDSDGVVLKTYDNITSLSEYLEFGNYKVVYDGFAKGVHKGHSESEYVSISSSRNGSVNIPFVEVTGGIGFDFGQIPFIDKLDLTYTRFGTLKDNNVTLTPDNPSISGIVLGAISYKATAYYKGTVVGAVDNGSITIDTDQIYKIDNSFILTDKGIVEVSITNDLPEYSYVEFYENGEFISKSLMKDNGIYSLIVPSGNYKKPSILVYSYDGKLLNGEAIATPFNIESQRICQTSISMTKEMINVTVHLNNILTNFKNVTYQKPNYDCNYKYTVTITSPLGVKQTRKLQNGIDEIVFENIIEGSSIVEVNCTSNLANDNSDILQHTRFEKILSAENSRVDIDLKYTKELVAILLPEYGYKDRLDHYHFSISSYENITNENISVSLSIQQPFAKNKLLFTKDVFDDIYTHDLRNPLSVYIAYYTSIRINEPMMYITERINNQFRLIDLRNSKCNENSPRLWIEVGKTLSSQYEMTSCKVDSLPKGTFVSRETCIYSMPTIIPGAPIAEHLVHVWGKTSGSMEDERELGTFTVSVKADYPGQAFEIVLESLRGNQFEVNLVTKN